MIDRLLLCLPSQYMPDGLFEKLLSRYGVLAYYDKHGEQIWEKPSTAKLRSDDPDVNFRFVKDGIQIWGSPAMQMAKNNVFGSSDIVVCAEVMIAKAGLALECELPHYKLWELKGLDITHNYYLDSPNDVKSALNFFGRLSDGRLKTVRYPESVYYGQGSKLRTGKVYAKGFQLDVLEKRMQDYDLGLNDWERASCYNLIRLELCLKSEWVKRYANKHYEQTGQGFRWWNMSENDLNVIYVDFWERITGNGIEIEKHDFNTEGRCVDAALSLGLSEGLGKSAFKTWSVIKSIGSTAAKDITTKATWYRHLKILKTAGLTSGDISEGSILPVRFTKIALDRRVESFDEVRRCVNG